MFWHFRKFFLAISKKFGNAENHDGISLRLRFIRDLEFCNFARLFKVPKWICFTQDLKHYYSSNVPLNFVCNSFDSIRGARRLKSWKFDKKKVSRRLNKLCSLGWVWIFSCAMKKSFRSSWNFSESSAIFPCPGKCAKDCSTNAISQGSQIAFSLRDFALIAEF